VSTIIDLTSIRGLYSRSGADPKTICILVDSGKHERILHLTFRRTYTTASKSIFEIDHYDRHFLIAGEVEKNPKAARPNLIGGGRLTSLSRRLLEMTTLRELVDSKKWTIHEGFIEGKTKKYDGLHLRNQTFLPTAALGVNGLDKNRIEKVVAEKFHDQSDPEVFQPPVILIREHESLPIAFWDQGMLTFKHKIIGIHSPSADKQNLINGWIDELAASSDPNWSTSDRLDCLEVDFSFQSSRSVSNHLRTEGGNESIQLTHLWIEM